LGFQPDGSAARNHHGGKRAKKSGTPLALVNGIGLCPELTVRTHIASGSKAQPTCRSALPTVAAIS
jgi:hypothetical protein